MIKRFFLPSLVIAGFVVLLNGCVLLEETGGSNRPETPQRSPAKIDTTRRLSQKETRPKPVTDTVKVAVKSPRVAPRFRSKQDTLKAAMVKKSKSNPQPARAIERPENPMYTVQVGAFSKASNALRMQKLAKQHFSKQPIFNKFGPKDKLYRVSVGKFEDRKSANSLRNGMMKQFPKDYEKCWVNYIAK